MDKHIFKIYSILLAIFLFLAIVFYLIGDEQIKVREEASLLKEPVTTLQELSEGITVCQTFTVHTETLEKLSFLTGTYNRLNRGLLKATLLDLSTGEALEKKLIDASLLQEGTYYEWVLENAILNSEGKSFSFVLESDCSVGEAPTLYCMQKDSSSQMSLTINNNLQDNLLCFRYTGKHFFFIGLHFWQCTAGITLLIILDGFRTIQGQKKGKTTIVLILASVWKKYQFLIKQLVVRDFKTKYKRSILGYLWSFLNPLLTMAVQYIVFSTLFRSDIQNFPVYLLTGIILFNFFSEAVGQGLISIVANSALITKVYVPKYIYPATKVISCSINLLISIIPLLIVTILTGTRITLATLLIPFVLVCLLVFCIGLSLALSAAMVFFRDTQYLWGIVSLIWTYATPLFYPESIIPARFQIILKVNPMYYFIRFARTLLIDGVSPDPMLYAYCLLSSLLAFIIGATIFKKTQDKFVLYI